MIGKKIRDLRKQNHVTQEQLAEVLSVSYQAVSKWENDRSTPDIDLLPIIAKYFGITMDELFDYPSGETGSCLCQIEEELNERKETEGSDYL
ncbi:MAG: helix-turn-helix transcriptional regulator [Eubacteriales bacterium]|nr:helix-turn-helix transcriptional regulator [Eubacteriales bacterium]